VTHPLEASATQRADGARGHLLVAITNSMVALYKRYYGKGPTKARTYYVDNLVVCTLKDGLTRVEETLARSGRGVAVSQQRRELQEAIRDEFVGAIEQLVGRRVVAFMSDTHTNPDVSVEIFMLEPEPGFERA
jgi:uncharacterized protein YbcI